MRRSRYCGFFGAGLRDIETDAPVSASALTATSSSDPLRLPWQPAQMLLNSARGGPGVMYSLAATWCSSVIVKTGLPLPSTNSRISGFRAGTNTFREWSDSNDAWPSGVQVPVKVPGAIWLPGALSS